MDTLLVGYDLNKSGKDYDGLFEQIKSSCSKWWHHLDSTWIIKTNKTCAEVRDLLSPFIDSDDELLVVKLSGVGAWKGFNSSGSDWLKENL
jgi:hypothetical protein